MGCCTSSEHKPPKSNANDLSKADGELLRAAFDKQIKEQGTVNVAFSAAQHFVFLKAKSLDGQSVQNKFDEVSCEKNNNPKLGGSV